MTRMDRDRFRGALLGLAAGDAVGTTVEFRPPGSFAPVTACPAAAPAVSANATRAALERFERTGEPFPATPPRTQAATAC